MVEETNLISALCMDPANSFASIHIPSSKVGGINQIVVGMLLNRIKAMCQIKIYVSLTEKYHANFI